MDIIDSTKGSSTMKRKSSKDIASFFSKRQMITEEQHRANARQPEKETESETENDIVATAEVEGSEQLDPDQPRPPGSGPAHGPADISKSRADGPKQAYLKVYPQTLYNDRRRGFNYKWFSTHKWLEYSQATNSSYCYACRHFSLPSSGDTVFTSEGLNNWKKAMFTDGGFATHAKSESDCNAMFAWALYKKTRESECSLPASMNTGYEKLVKEN
ncbi:uncharacterized protein LOC121654671 [Melanotaenia boesemani]|uniref:uncharacterized protein LOC121654671 n=1 Tax=Melanotaenia boesemani TaxID=1250792 RepID=UPI001C04DA43|nr:uncharacterized protein LOC121654671 [Melanotaenia boesemani]